MTTKAGEGEKFVNFALGSGKGKCDEVVSFPKDGDGKGNKTLVSAHSGYAVELVGVVDGTEKNLMEKESGLRGNWDKAQENLKTIAEVKAQLQAVVDGAGSENAVDDPNEPENPQVAKAKAQLAEIEEKEYEKTAQKEADAIQTALDAVTGELKETRVQKLHDGEENLRRENDAREAIAFVDGLGLAVLGVDNVQGFFDAVSEKYGLSENEKIDPAKRPIDAHQKQLILQVFSRLVGSSDGEAGMFDPTTHGLKDGKNDQDVRALQSR